MELGPDPLFAVTYSTYWTLAALVYLVCENLRKRLVRWYERRTP